MRAAVAIALFVVVILAGCGSTDSSTPVACLEGEKPYLEALKGAPGEVTIDGETRISDCLAEYQQGGDLATVGEAMLAAATRLNAEARNEPGGAANLRLGYLLGAAERGASGTAGIHAELIRRLGAAARYSPDNRPLSRIFLKTYESGYAAGVKNG